MHDATGRAQSLPLLKHPVGTDPPPPLLRAPRSPWLPEHPSGSSNSSRPSGGPHWPRSCSRGPIFQIEKLTLQALKSFLRASFPGELELQSVRIVPPIILNMKSMLGALRETLPCPRGLHHTFGRKLLGAPGFHFDSGVEGILRLPRFGDPSAPDPPGGVPGHSPLFLQLRRVYEVRLGSALLGNQEALALRTCASSFLPECLALCTLRELFYLCWALSSTHKLWNQARFLGLWQLWNS